MDSLLPLLGTTSQEFIFSEAIAADARVVLLEAVCVCYTVHVCCQLVVPPTIRESPRPRVVQRRTFLSNFPDGSWEQMNDLELSDLDAHSDTQKLPSFFASEVATEYFGAALEGETSRQVCRRQAESRA